MTASKHLEESTLKHFFLKTSIPVVTQPYISLYLTDPTDNDIGIEVSGGGYSPQPINFGNLTKVAGKTTISNINEIQFSAATGNWGVIAFYGIRDKASNGNLLTYAPLKSTKMVENGDEVKLKVGTITIAID